jgi:hypothetical protein
MLAARAVHVLALGFVLHDQTAPDASPADGHPDQFGAEVLLGYINDVSTNLQLSTADLTIV